MAMPFTSGGSTWVTGSYDPDTGLLFLPTGNPFPDTDGADRLRVTTSIRTVSWHSTPRRASSRWHYQFTPQDLHDWDATEPLVLTDTEFLRQYRKLLLRKPERILLRPGPDHGRVAARRTLREEACLGQRHQQGWASGAAGGQSANYVGHEDLPRCSRSNELVLDRIQPVDEAVLCDGS